MSTIYRNGMKFKNEEEYNEWAIGETKLIIENTEHLYNEYHGMLSDNSRRRMIKRVMREYGIMFKDKNMKKVFEELKED